MESPADAGPLEVLCVLGMHRSGTSCLAGILAEAGLNLGEVNTWARANASGNREHPRVMALHEDLLYSNGGSWDFPPQRVRWGNSHRQRRDEFVEVHRYEVPWGWKDPRSLFTIEGWLEIDLPLEFVGTFRHPSAVAQSLSRREGRSSHEWLDLWYLYNQRLLTLHQRFDFPLLNFDLDDESYLSSVRTTLDRLGLSHAHLDFFDPALRHLGDNTHDEGLPSAIGDLYEELRSRSVSPSPLGDKETGARIDGSPRTLLRRPSTPIATPTRLPLDRVSMSVVIGVYDMAREVPRTVQSLISPYQLRADELDYDLTIVDNGSPETLVRDAAWPDQLRVVRVEDASPSPVGALNRAAFSSSGEVIGLMIDGARILTPGVLGAVAELNLLYKNPIVSTLGYHLGPVPQNQSIDQGYSAEVEDDLLSGICWPDDGYRLFEIGCLAGSSKHGVFWPQAESNALFLRRELFQELGGFDERFASPGGGLANLDLYRRALTHSDTTAIVLAGEGTFHQVHGGVATGGRSTFAELSVEYEEIHGCELSLPDVPILHYGRIHPAALPTLEYSAARAIELTTLGVDRTSVNSSPSA